MRNDSPNGDRIPTPTSVVCLDTDNSPIPRVSMAEANFMCARGWAEWVGKGTRRHLRLTGTVPLQKTPRASGTSVRRDRADHTCKAYSNGQAFGFRGIVEHLPINK
jgi:hypothetical protein